MLTRRTFLRRAAAAAFGVVAAVYAPSTKAEPELFGEPYQMPGSDMTFVDEKDALTTKAINDYMADFDLSPICMSRQDASVEVPSFDYWILKPVSSLG